MEEEIQIIERRKVGRPQKGLYKKGLNQEDVERIAPECEGKYAVYGLVSDLNPLNLRYIGFAKLPLNLRYNNHVAIKTMEAEKEKVETEKEKWLKEVLGAGDNVIMVVIEDAIETKSDACKAERAYIRGFRDAGAELTNITRGGMGTDGMHHSEKTKEKQRQARIKKVADKTVVQMAVHSMAA